MKMWNKKIDYRGESLDLGRRMDWFGEELSEIWGIWWGRFGVFVREDEGNGRERRGVGVLGCNRVGFSGKRVGNHTWAGHYPSSAGWGRIPDPASRTPRHPVDDNQFQRAGTASRVSHPASDHRQSDAGKGTRVGQPAWVNPRRNNFQPFFFFFFLS